MPSPKRGVPISAVASKWFGPIAGDERQAFIPSSIMPNTAATLEGSIKVLICSPDEPPSPGEQFLTRERLTIQAKIPWLNRYIPHFGYSREIDIQYPVELRSFRFLPSMAQGSMTRFTFVVRSPKFRNHTKSSITERSSSLDTKSKFEGFGK